MDRKIAKNIDDYIDHFPKETRELLKKMRSTIRKAAPDVEESISYGMPTFRSGRNRVYFAGYKNHIGFYPGGAIAPFKVDLSAYKSSKGGVQFPIDKPLPVTLVARIVKARMKHTDNRKKTYSDD